VVPSRDFRSSTTVACSAWSSSAVGVLVGVLKRAVYFGLFLAGAIGGFAPRGFAHRGPAEVLSLPAWGDSGALVLRLNEGLAIRRCDRWKYVCPALWGADNIAQAEVIPGGPVAIAGPSGLFLLRDDGSVTPHPDPAALGPVIRFATAGEALFALRTRDQRGEVVRVTPGAIEVVWSDPGVTWTALAADGTALHLVRNEGTRLFHAQLSLQGEPIAMEEVTLPEAFLQVQGASVTRGRLYVIALRLMGGLELGRIDQGAWLSDCTGGDNLSGPVESEGELLVTVNRSLARVAGQCSEIIATPEQVSCVGQESGRSYACTRSGASLLHGDGVGSPLFLLAELTPPDLGVVPAEVQPLCSAQWSRYREDLLSLGVIDQTATVDNSSGGDCGATAGNAPSAGAAGLPQTGPAGKSGAGAGGAAEEPGGCGVGGAIDSLPAGIWLVWIALGLWIGHRSRGTALGRP
jgi:hypothetical protein